MKKLEVPQKPLPKSPKAVSKTKATAKTAAKVKSGKAQAAATGAGATAKATASSSNKAGVARKSSNISLHSNASEDSKKTHAKKIQKVGLLQSKTPDDVSPAELAAICQKAESVDDLFGPDTPMLEKINLSFAWFGDNRERVEWEYIDIAWEVEIDGVLCPTMVPSVHNRDLQEQTLAEYEERMTKEGYVVGAAGASAVGRVEVVVLNCNKLGHS